MYHYNHILTPFMQINGVCPALPLSGQVGSNNVSCLAGKYQSKPRWCSIPIPWRGAPCKEVGVRLHGDGGDVSVGWMAGLHPSGKVMRGATVCVCEPLASAREMGAWSEYRETLFFPLRALLVMDETALASFSSSLAMQCGKLGLFLPSVESVCVTHLLVFHHCCRSRKWEKLYLLM